MEKALFLGAIIGPLYLILGISTLLYPAQWKKVIGELGKNHLMFVYGLIMELILGLILVNTYNVWSWDIYLVITLTGWGAVLEASFYLLAPSNMIKRVLKWAVGMSDGWLYFWGMVTVVLGFMLSYNSYFTASLV